ncbi:MAG: RNA polymerase sigma-70 factor [Bacteroidota bacterium]
MPGTAITESLIKRFVKGKPDAFRVIFDHFHARVLAYCTKITHSSADAEEVTQQVFIRLWEKRHLVDSSRPLEHYLYKITRNCAFSYLKQQASRAQQLNTTEFPQAASMAVADDEISLAECRQLTDALVESLPEKRQVIYKMHFEEGYSPAEIANLLGLSLSTVKSQLAKATQTVKGFLLNYRSASIISLLHFIDF